MKIKILEYEMHKAGVIKVQSHNYRKGKWKINKKYDFHKMLINNARMFPIIYKREYTKEVGE